MNATVPQTSTHLNLSSKPLPLTPLQHHPQPPHHHQHGHTHTTTKPSLRDRLAIIRHIPVPIYNHLVAFTSEFLGTTFYLFFALAGAQVAATTAFIPFTNISGISPPSTPPPAALLYTALSFGFSLAVTAWVFFRVTSGLFSPSVTLGMVLLGTLKWGRGVVVFVSQILGGVVAAALVEAVFPGNIGAVGTVLGSGTSLVRGFFIEVLLTAAFVFSVFMLAADKHKGTFIAPIGIGLALFIAELVGAPYTGCSLNPARSFGPAVVTHHFPAYHWIYWTGPSVGSFFAAGFYHAVKALEVETSVAMHGESVLGHRRGVSNSSTVPAAHHMVPRDAHSGHQLGPVHENDLEKGIEHPHQVSATGSESPASPGKCAGQLHYLSGLTAVGDTSVGDADVTKEARSPRPSTHRER